MAKGRKVQGGRILSQGTVADNYEVKCLLCVYAVASLLLPLSCMEECSVNGEMQREAIQ